MNIEKLFVLPVCGDQGAERDTDTTSWMQASRGPKLLWNISVSRLLNPRELSVILLSLFCALCNAE